MQSMRSNTNACTRPRASSVPCWLLLSIGLRRKRPPKCSSFPFRSSGQSASRADSTRLACLQCKQSALFAGQIQPGASPLLLKPSCEFAQPKARQGLPRVNAVRTFAAPSESPIHPSWRAGTFSLLTTYSPLAPPRAPPHRRLPMPERPAFGSRLWRAPGVSTATPASHPQTCNLRRCVAAHPAERSPATRSSQALTHHRTNHLFDEGKKDVAGKSHDSCT
jgi:hypothetical protein